MIGDYIIHKTYSTETRLERGEEIGDMDIIVLNQDFYFERKGF